MEGEIEAQKYGAEFFWMLELYLCAVVDVDRVQVEESVYRSLQHLYTK